MIRRATMLDLPWLRKLHQDFCAQFDSPYPTMDVEEFDKFVVSVARSMREDPSFLCLVAEEAGNVVGYLGGGIMQRACGKPNLVATVFWLYVDPAFRGKRIGTHLCTLGLAWVREFFPQVTELEVPSRADDLQWAERGFKPFMVYHHGPLSVGDAWLARAPKTLPEKANGHDPAPPKRRRRKRQPDIPAELVQ